MYLKLEHVVPNAFIFFKKRYLSFYEIERYGESVISKINKRCILLFSRDHTREFFREYSKYFERGKGEGEGEGVKLRDEITYEMLIDKFLGYLPLELLLAFISGEDKEKYI